MPVHASETSIDNSASLAPYQLHNFILEYLSHQCYSKTAHAFARDTSIRLIDADGDEIMEPSLSSQHLQDSGLPVEALKSIHLREVIRNYILSGRVDEAITMIGEHFPSVLDTTNSADPTLYHAKTASGQVEYVSTSSVNPAHISLNLRILAFTEACRTVPLVYHPRSSCPEQADPSTSSDDPFTPSDPTDEVRQAALLLRAQKLYALATMLPNPDDRAKYMKELSHVAGLLAYKEPEICPMNKYLSQERREAVADQVNNAILHSLGSPPVSRLELYTRYTLALVDRLRASQAKVPPSNRPPWLRLIWPDLEDPKSAKQEASVLPPLDLKALLDVKT